ncbi:MAG TPA: TetR/AcrR family transcriptional regulator [Pseudolysinimonas sp.]|nr:TetR/AcrR family transcriptional regulator [Pseudolysinimonas sp.]
MATPDELRTIALDAFASSGYLGTSLQQIADKAGVSKASVLYHFASKEALLESALTPAIDQLAVLIDELDGLGGGREARAAFLARFVDLLLLHRAALYVFVNQSGAIEDTAVIQRAGALVQRIAAYFAAHVDSVEEKTRFGVALGGATYLLVSMDRFGAETPPDDVLRPALVRVLGELIDPIPAPAD